MRDNIIIKSFTTLFKADKVIFVISYGLTLIQGLTRVLPIIAIQRLFDALTDIAVYGKNKVFLYLALFVGARILKHIISLFTNYIYEKYDLIAGKGMKNNVNQKVMYASAISFENVGFLENVNKAYRGTDSIRRFIDVWMMIIFLYIPETLTVLIYLYKASPYLLLLLIPIVISSAIVLRLQEKEYAQQEETCANLSRKIDVYEKLLFDVRGMIETKVVGYGELIKSKAFTCIDEKAKSGYKYSCAKNNLENIEKTIILLGRISIFVVLAFCTSKEMITVGVFAALLSSLDELFSIVEDILSVITQGVSESLEKIRNYFELMDMPGENQREGCVLDSINTISFNKVSFKYPGSDKDAIRNMSLDIKKGDHIAVVGENGSGKSTFVKLLCGLYRCSKGDVYINGLSINNYSRTAVFDKFTTVFQQFGKYAMTVKENIVLAAQEDESLYKKVIKEVDEKVAGIDSEAVLSLEYGGIDISGGQWQRLAICRARYKDGEVYLLDEPTSAIDPNEEKRLYDLFEYMTRGKTSVIVTHRMSAARLASKILVLNKGEVCGFGTHDELFENCLEYRKLWDSQAGMYA
jgi:ATP-binding cassette subfamily B protein